MEYISFFDQENKTFWLEKLAKCDWTASQHLYEVIKDNQFFDKFGKMSQLLLLIEGDQLVGHCTLAEHDNIPDSSFSPWIGYVFVDPIYRGQKLFKKLLAEGEARARQQGYQDMYISSAHVNLYEQYGYRCLKETNDFKGRYTKIFHKRLN